MSNGSRPSESHTSRKLRTMESITTATSTFAMRKMPKPQWNALMAKSYNLALLIRSALLGRRSCHRMAMAVINGDRRKRLRSNGILVEAGGRQHD